MLGIIARTIRATAGAVLTAAGDVVTAASNALVNPAPVPAAASTAQEPQGITANATADDLASATDEDLDTYVTARREQGARRLARARRLASLARAEKKMARAELGDVEHGEVIGEYVMELAESAPIFDSERAKQLLDDAHIAHPKKEKAASLRLVKIAEKATEQEEPEPAAVQATLPEPAPQPPAPETIAAAREALPPNRETCAAAALRDLAAAVDTLPPAGGRGFASAFGTAFNEATSAHPGTSVRSVRTIARKAIREAASDLASSRLATAADLDAAFQDGTLTDPGLLRRVLTTAADALAA